MIIKISILYFILCGALIQTNAQLPMGIFESGKLSFRTNYFLKVERDSVTLFGWETLIDKDTIYFKSTSKNDIKQGLVFNNFKFSKYKMTDKNIDSFTSQTNIKIEQFVLYRHFFNFQVIDSRISILATKDTYHSRADKFEFVKIR
jgi:hypothetical protein